MDLLCFCSVLCLLCLCARLFICALWSPAGKGLTSWLSFVVSTVSLSLSLWYPGSGVVLDCIDSRSLHHYLLLLAPDGVACMTIHRNISDLCLFIKELASSLKLNDPVQYEVASFVFPNKNKNSDSDSDFSGFNPVSDGEYTCKLYMAQEAINSAMTDSSEISSVSVYTCSSDDSQFDLESSELDQCIQGINDSTTFMQNIDFESFSHIDYDADDHTDDGGGNDDDDNGDYIADETDKIADDHTDDGGGNDDDDDDDDEDDDDDDDDDNDDDDDYIADESCQSSDSENIPLIRLKRKTTKEKNISVGGTSEIDQSGDGQSAQSVDNLAYQSEDGPISHSGDGHFQPAPSNSVGVQSQSTESQSTHDPSRGTISRGRKRKRDPANWQRNIAKRRCNSGESYINKKGIQKPARRMKHACGYNCRFKCQSKYPNEIREEIFHSFWKLADIDKQRQFILQYTEKKQKKKTKLGQTNRRKSSISWFLPNPNYQSHCDNIKVKVCKTLFLNTLGISDKMVTTVYKKINNIGMCMDDSRGKFPNRPNETSEIQKMYARKHINSFETVESHYCRKDSAKSYLPHDLNISKMYRLYLKYCADQNAPSVSHYIYNQIFNTEFNLAFHTPLKDQCDLCISFANASEAEKEKLSEKYDSHMKNKNLVQEHKTFDKAKALQNDDTAVCCFDLEEVLLTPHSFESCLYFKRRLNTFNFTIYDFGTRDGYCFVWNEAIASRGACEIASCLLSFIEKLSKTGKRKLVMYSDNCCGQNKNRYFVTMLWYALQKFGMQSITQKYLEKGHTFNEGDSIHSSIENVSRHNKIYTTPQWAATIRTARPSRPYIVHELNVHDFYHFKELSQKLKNFEMNTDNEKVYWNSIRTITFRSESPNQFEYQTDYDGPNYTVDLLKKQRSKIPKPASISLTHLREDGIQIPRAKYVDLLRLCTSNIIPSVHHPFFLLLPHD